MKYMVYLFVCGLGCIDTMYIDSSSSDSSSSSSGNTYEIDPQFIETLNIADLYENPAS